MRLSLIEATGFLVLFTFGHALAAEVLDQQNDVSPSATADSTSGGFLEQAQTFTVGVTGTLSRIAVQINFPGFGSPGNAMLTVYSTTGGLPDASLGAASLSSAGIPSNGYDFQSFDVSSYAIPVHAGDVLAYGITSSLDSYFFLRSTFDHSTYDGGQSLWRQVNPTGPWTAYDPPHDGGFQTYIIPSAVGLPGDFNNDGHVDAADYVLWRDHLGAATEAALNGNGDGMNGVDQGDYTLWRGHFNDAAGAAALEAADVPEPATAATLIIATLGCVASRRGRSLFRVSAVLVNLAL